MQLISFKEPLSKKVLVNKFNLFLKLNVKSYTDLDRLLR